MESNNKMTFYKVKKYELYIGIDPGVNTGFVVWSTEVRKCVAWYTLSFWQTIDRLRGWSGKTHGQVIIEDPGQNSPVWIDGKTPVNRSAELIKIAQNVGMNKAYAKLIIQYCEENNIPCQAVKPSTQKWTPQMFKATTRIQKPVSQHVRDAAKLVVGLV